MLGIGTNELVIILIFAFLLFGPDKLPGMGRTIGRALRQFREAQEGFTQVVQSEVVDPLTDAMNEPAKGKSSKKAASSAKDDADIEEGGDAAQHVETFAERRERLKAERLKAEQAAAAQKKDAAQEGKPDTDGNEAEAGSPAAKDATTQKPPESPVEAKASDTDTSAAALYSLAPRKEDGDAHD
ncbi:MAG: twin-arginine translocase TatA/TatE family subunit [Atopobium sp.]|nr:twin-arginine translocase TatA/TatE family subunit [Atopobium sp.]